MFAIASPQTVLLTVPGDDHPSTLINFRTNGADTSRCVLEIVTPEGDTHRLAFNVRGQMVESQFIDHNSAPETPAPAPASYMVDGVDTRAFNPYTYQPPLTADSAYQTPAPARVPDTPEQRELREQHHAEAADRAKEMLDKHLNKIAEPQSERVPREEQERRDRLLAAQEDQRTPGLDQQGGLQDPHATAEVFPNDEIQRLVAGKRMDGSPQHPSSPSGFAGQGSPPEPMAPAPSSPLPGSPPPHPLDQPDPGKVNTTQTLQGA